MVIHVRRLLFACLFCLSSISYADLLVGMTAFHMHDYKTAYNYLEPYAKKGNVEAMYLMGRMYQLGRGVKSSPKQAFYWFHKLLLNLLPC